jgi:hypothetical protein
MVLCDHQWFNTAVITLADDTLYDKFITDG